MTEELSTFACNFFRINDLNCVWPLKYKIPKKFLSFRNGAVIQRDNIDNLKRRKTTR